MRRGRAIPGFLRKKRWHANDHQPFAARADTNPRAREAAPARFDAANADEPEDIRDRFASIRCRLLGLDAAAARSVDDVPGRLDGDADRSGGKT